jgi:menaquinol-cytochrome c reductase iron-sulfur subunit
MVNVHAPPSMPSEEPTRRGFHLTAIYGLMGIVSAALALPALAYLFVPAKSKKTNQWVDAGDIGKLAPDAPMKMVFRRQRIDGWRVISEDGTAWVVKQPDNRIVAYGPNCTHLGCAYHWETDKKDFLCPCHNSIFGVDGKVTAGPAPRPLDQFETRVEGTRLLLGQLRPSTEQKA